MVALAPATVRASRSPTTTVSVVGLLPFYGFGVTEFDAGDSAPLPTLFFATTVKV